LALGAASFYLASAFPWLPVFVLGSVIAMTASSSVIPLLTQIYQENYPETERGRLFSKTVMVRIAVAAGFGNVAGDALSGHIHKFPLLLLVFGTALAVAAFCIARCPGRPIPPDGGAHPLRALRFVKMDSLFRRTLICWMLMGFANLMMLPLRVEFLANPKYGWHVTVGKIAFLTAVVPNLARLVMSPVWGYLFDHVNFFSLRVTLNIGFATGILSFFLSHTLSGMVIGAIIFGISNAGGDVAWSLWVTKIAPPERVADYMSGHTFLTGIRGLLAPLCAFYLAAHEVPLGLLAGASTVLIFIATLLLIPEMRLGRKSWTRSTLAEDAAD
jgi:MFS family permease